MFDLEANKAIALRGSRFSTAADFDLLDDALHPEFRGRGLSAFPPVGHEVGPGARRKLYEMFYQAMPDARAEALDVIAEGDKVVIVDRFGGTHRGEFFGRRDTGDRIEWRSTSTSFVTAKDAAMTDALAIMQQLGLVLTFHDDHTGRSANLCRRGGDRGHPLKCRRLHPRRT